MQTDRKRKHTDGSRHLRGFTLVELLVVIAIISVLAAILMPALRRIKGLTGSTACMSNLRMMGLAEALYTSQHNGYVAYNRGDVPGHYGLYWACHLWMITTGETPPKMWSPASPMEAPDWFKCPSPLEAGFPVWSDVYIAGVNCLWWMKDIHYSRNYEIGGWRQDNINPPRLTMSVRLNNLANPSETADIIDGGPSLHFSSYPYTRTERLNASGEDPGPYSYNNWYGRSASYRHGNLDSLNVLLWDGHVASVEDSVADTYRILP